MLKYQILDANTMRENLFFTDAGIGQLGKFTVIFSNIQKVLISIFKILFLNSKFIIHKVKSRTFGKVTPR